MANTSLEVVPGVKVISEIVLRELGIDERMKQLGSSEKYLRELSRLTRANRIPADWATPEQRAKAALKTLRK
jgi:hypothetical protein